MNVTSDAQPLQSLCGIGGYTALLQASSVVFAVIGYFIWPHIFADAKIVFKGIQSSPLVFFMKLDPIVLFGTLLQLPVWLGLWAALRKTNASFATLALSMGFVSTVAVLPTRPLVELYSLAFLHAGTDVLSQKEVYLAAGEALLAQFHGTSWAISIMTGGLAAILFGVIMRQNPAFRLRTTLTMIGSGVGALFVLVPVVGIVLLFFLATIGGVAASIFTGLDLIRLSRQEFMGSTSEKCER